MPIKLPQTNRDNTSWKRFLNPTKLVKEKLLSGFRANIVNWKDEGRINESDVEQILAAIDDPEVQIYLNLLVQQNILTTFIIRTEVCAALGAILTGGLDGIAVSEAVRMSIRNLHIQIAGRKLPFKDRQKAAFGGMLFGIGGEMPIILLYQLLRKRYPDLYKYFRIYLSNRKLYNILSRQKSEGKSTFTKREQKYLDKKFPDQDITPENLVEIERSHFFALLRQFA